MFADCIENINKYRGMCPALDAGLIYLENIDLSETFEEKVVEITDEVKAVYIIGELRDSLEAQFEIHENYMDIHLIVDGIEKFEYSLQKPENNYCYDADHDIAFITNVDSVEILHLHSGFFCAVWPKELHKPLVKVANNEDKVKKIILKVKI